MIDLSIQDTADPVPADIVDYTCPITAVFTGGECGVA